MTTIKIGGVLLTGLAAYLVLSKAIGTIDNSTKRACEASMWKNYYKCWSEGNAEGEPIPPGYSRTSPVTSEVDENAVAQDPNEAAAKAAVDLIKEGLSKLKVTITKPAEKQEEASEERTEPNDGTELGSEGQEKASAIDIIDSMKDFNTKVYQLPPDYPPVDIEHGFDKKAEICRISNLIITMTANDADKDELERAIKHSMVIIDAEKYRLDYKQSYVDNRIDQLIEKYQPEVNDIANDVLDYMEKKYEVVTEVDENGKPVAGRYSYGVEEENKDETVD